MNSRPILQKSISMSTLSTSVQVITKSKPYYLKTNLKKAGENVRAASETEEYRKIPRCIDIFRAKFWHTAAVIL